MFHTRVLVGCFAAVMMVAGCSKKDDPAVGTATASTTETTPKAESSELDVAALAAEIGVEPGPWASDPEVGAEAAVTATSGTVEIRRVGEEQFADSGAEATLRAGDQLRTGSEGAATLVLTDGTTIEVAADSAVAIGDRDAQAEPAAQMAVLYGVARFTVSPRAEGEGPFLVFTPNGVVGTKGTTYVVGVAATGATRVGVEEGTVEVVGGADLATALEVTGGAAADLDVSGVVGAPAAFDVAAWGSWRDEIEATVEPAATAEVHAEALTELEGEVDIAYGDLDVLTAAAMAADADARAHAETGDVEAYVAIAPELGATVEASYLASLRLEYLTYAMLSHAYIAGELQVRHPEAVGPVYVTAAPRIHGAVLYHKKYHGVVHGHIRPLRPLWWRHHPTGRARVVVHGHTLEPFYAKATLKPIPAERVNERVQVTVYRPPSVEVRDHRRKVLVGPPVVRWHASAEVKGKAPKVKADWYVRPKTPRATLVAGVAVKAPARAAFEVRPPAPRPPHVRIGVARPDIKIRINGGVSIGGKAYGAGGMKARGDLEGRANTRVPAVRADSKGKAAVEGDVRANVKVPAVRGKAKATVNEKVPAVRGKAKAGVNEKVPAVRGKAKAGAGVEIKAPKVEPPKAKVKASGGVKAGVKIGD